MGHSKSASHIAIAALSVGLLASGTNAARAADASSGGGWTGPYIGVSGGGEIFNNKWKAESMGPGNAYGVDPSSADRGLVGAGGRFGGYAGWDLPVAPNFIAGIEGDIAGIVGGKKSATGIPGATYNYPSMGINGVTPLDSVSAKPNFDAGLRARLGYVVDPMFLVYGTTGVAFQNTDYKANCPGSSTTSTASFCGVPESQTLSKTLVGWTLGAGAEAKLANQLFARLEYRYADFGSQNLNFFGSSNLGADSFSAKADPSSHIITIGITYRFGSL
jgi:outer membrane immunogenic protein